MISAARRRRLVRQVPESFTERLLALYSHQFDLIERVFIAQINGERWRLPVVVQPSAAHFRDDSAAARDLFELFTYGLEREIITFVDWLFRDITKFTDSNVRRSLPTLSADTIFPQRMLSGLRQKQVDKITAAAKWQVRKAQNVIDQNVGLNTRDLTKLLQESTKTTKNQARLWARDQTLKFNAAVTKERHQYLGVTEYIWTTSQDERVRERHAELANRTFQYSNPPDSDSGEPINPGEDYQCRCIAFPVTPSAGLLNTPPDLARITARQARAAEILNRPRRTRRRSRSQS
jgi:SPP1 gp7 family putative phage head morphogenesis protein